MANEYILKEFDGGTVATVLNGGINGSATSITLLSGATFPTGGTAPFVVSIDRGSATEEKVLVDTRSGNTLTVLERGYDGTSAQAHADGAAVVHVLDAYSIAQANAMANTMTTLGDLIRKGTGDAYARIAVGSAGLPLVSDGTVPAYAQLGTAGIADDAITTAKLAAAVEALLVPAGTIAAYVGSSAPTGWLLHNQTVVGAQSSYPALWAVAPASWKSGSDLEIPNLSDRVLVQTGGSAALLGATGGAMSVTIAEANLPAHTHSINHDHAAVTSAAGSAHSHTFSGTTSGQSASHTHEQNVAAAGVGASTLRTDFTSDSTSAGVIDQNNVSTDAASNDHTHTYSGTTATEGAHTHSVDVAAFTGTSGSTGSGTALTTRPAHLGVNFILKAH